MLLNLFVYEFDGKDKLSKVIRHLGREGKVKIVAAKYDLDDGKVSLLK